MRRLITSPRTALLLLLLLERPRTSVELARELGLSASEVNAYLHYYRRKGLLEKQGGLWSLTKTGEGYVKSFASYFYFILESVYGIKMHKEESKLYSEARILEKAREWAGSSDCLEIVRFLAHYTLERGRTYFEAGSRGLAEALAEALEDWSGSGYVSPFRVAECLEELERKGVVYIYKSRKVRLHRRLLELSRVSP